MLTHHHPNPHQPSRVVLFGAGGFIGRSLAHHLGRAGVRVHALGRDAIDLGNDTAANSITAELNDGDTVVFLSALTPDKGRGSSVFLANIKMAESICTAVKDKSLRQFVYVSSDAVYPFRDDKINENSCAEPTDLYSAMHISREIMIKASVTAPLAILRPTLVFGAGDTHNSYGPNRFRREARKDGRITLFGGGEETRDHILIDDVVELMRLVVAHTSTGTLNLATGYSVSFRHLAEKVASFFDRPIEIIEKPRQTTITHRAFDVTAIHRHFSTFRFTPLEKGLTSTQEKDAE